MIEIFLLLLTVLVFVISIKWGKNIKSSRKLDWIPSVPGWPVIGNILEFGPSTDTISDMERLTRNHGKLLKIDILTEPNLIAADYDFLEFILSSNQVLNKATDYEYLQPWLGTGLLTSDGPKWKKRRRMVTPAFHFSILEKFVDSFESNGKVLIEKLGRQSNKDSVEIYSLINLYTLDVICEAAMGVKVNAQQNFESDYVKNVKEQSRITIERAFSVFKGNDLTYKFSKDYYKEVKNLKALHDVTYAVIDARKKELEEKADTGPESDNLGRKKKLAFLDILLRSTVDGQPLTREDVREEVDTFMFEGHDTTASAISFTLYLLAHHPDIQKQAVEEQREIFGDEIERTSTYNDLNEMKYLELVIKEGLRLYPPVPMFSRRTNADMEYKGNIIPKGINISLFCYGILRDPDYYPEPDKFDPSRFDYNDGTKPYSYIPFSAGPRNCIGQKFAMLELKSCLSKVLRNFELSPAVPEHKPILTAELTLKPTNGLKIGIVKRKW